MSMWNVVFNLSAPVMDPCLNPELNTSEIVILMIT